jgi:hypothetical protein
LLSIKIRTCNCYGAEPLKTIIHDLRHVLKIMGFVRNSFSPSIWKYNMASGQFSMCRIESNHTSVPQLYKVPLLSVATVMTDVFHKNEINLLRKFSKIVSIFDKVDDSKS